MEIHVDENISSGRKGELKVKEPEKEKTEGIDTFHDRAGDFPASEFFQGEGEGKIESKAPRKNDMCKKLLGQLIRGYEMKAKNLRTILGFLPRDLTKQQDEALWSLVVDSRKH